MATMNAIIITQNTEERILLSQVLEWAGLSVSSNQNFDTLAHGGQEKQIDLMILAQETAKLQEAMWHARHISNAPMIVITDFINDDARVALYEAGADLVLVRPYSPRLLMVQAGMIAQKGGSRAFPQASRQPSPALPVEPFVSTTRPLKSVSMYQL